MDKPTLVTFRCSRCERALPPEAFAPSARNKSGAWCRACHSQYNAERYVPAPARDPKQPRGRPGRTVPLITHGARPSGTRWRRLQEQVWASETNCGICGQYVDQTLPVNDKRARSLDHIIPIARGGAMYERDNVRLAHRSCNSRAGNQLVVTERVTFLYAAIWISQRLDRHAA